MLPEPACEAPTLVILSRNWYVTPDWEPATSTRALPLKHKGVVVINEGVNEVGIGSTVKTTSEVEPVQAPLPASEYRMVTLVAEATLAGVYVVPAMEPPPETTLQEPPAGVPVNAFVELSQMAALEVVLLAVPGLASTVKVTSDVEPGQAPLPAIV